MIAVTWFKCTCGRGGICGLCSFMAGVCITILVVAIVASYRNKKKRPK